MKLLASVTGVKYPEKRTLDKKTGTNTLVSEHICGNIVETSNDDNEYRFPAFAKLFRVRYIIKKQS